MKINTLLFTQTMHSLLMSALSLQDSLSVCCEILSSSADKKFCKKILKLVNEGRRLNDALSEYGSLFSPLYLSLVYIGEESGTLSQVFGKLSEYLKERKNIRQKMIQALAYPVLVLFTAVIVIFILLMFVMPRLESIFMAFAETSDEIVLRAESIKTHLVTFSVFMAGVILALLALLFVHKFNEKVAFYIDSVLLKIPGIGKVLTVMQIHDFSFAMKLLSDARFPFVDSLRQAAKVLSNLRLRKAVLTVFEKVSDGRSAGECFEAESVFPKYLVIWIKIAERNGNTALAFSQISDYYSGENENILGEITAFAEPVFILITGIIIIGVISQFVLPVFKLLGTL